MNIPCVAVLLLMLFFTPTPLRADQTNDPINLTLGTLPAADSLALHVAVKEGFFAQQGLKVTVAPFQSALELSAAVRAGAVDGYFGDIINVILLHESGVPQRIVATTSHTAPDARFFGIVVPPDSKAQHLSDLRHAKIAIGRATIVEFLLDQLLQHQGVLLAEAQRVDIRQIPVRLQMLLSGQIDAAVLPEPLVSLMEAKGAHVLTDDRGLDLPLAVVALNQKQATPQIVKGLQTALGEAMHTINNTPDASKNLMLQRKLLPKDAANTYRMVRFNPTHTPTPLPSPADLQVVGDWMQTKGLLKRAPDLHALLNGSAT